MSPTLSHDRGAPRSEEGSHSGQRGRSFPETNEGTFFFLTVGNPSEYFELALLVTELAALTVTRRRAEIQGGSLTGQSEGSLPRTDHYERVLLDCQGYK